MVRVMAICWTSGFIRGKETRLMTLMVQWPFTHVPWMGVHLENQMVGFQFPTRDLGRSNNGVTPCMLHPGGGVAYHQCPIVRASNHKSTAPMQRITFEGCAIFFDFKSKMQNYIHPLKLTVRPRKWAIPKGNDRIPTIHFQVLLLLVSGRVLSTFCGKISSSRYPSPTELLLEQEYNYDENRGNFRHFQEAYSLVNP